jgi:polyhydroxyalkanoate synthase
MPRYAIHWTIFENLDRIRRLQGRMLETAGFGPVQSPFQTIFSTPHVTLRRYGTGREVGPRVLIVPAPIKRPYIWDLTPDASAVLRCLQADSQVFLLEWLECEGEAGLAQFADRSILDCIDATGGEAVTLVAHSLGGLFAAIFSALHPDRVNGLVLLASPLHFGLEAGIFGPMVTDLDLRDLPESVPGSFLSATSFRASPATFGWDRWLDWLQSFADSEAMTSHLRVERWTLDEFPLPRRLFSELAEGLAREDRFARGDLAINGARATPSQVTAPLLCAVDPGCRIVPPGAVLPFYEKAGSRDKTLLHYHGDIGVSLRHVGVLVGKSAHALLWPKIVSWIRAH